MAIQRSASGRVDEKLAAAWLTRAVRPQTRATLARLGVSQQVTAGTVLVREGDPSTFVAVVVAGRIGLRLRVPERGALTVLTVEPGDVIGWSALVRPYRSTSTVLALADSELVRFEADVLRDALADDDGLAAEFYPVVLAAVARRLEGTRLQLLDLFSQRWVEPW